MQFLPGLAFSIPTVILVAKRRWNHATGRQGKLPPEFLWTGKNLTNLWHCPVQSGQWLDRWTKASVLLWLTTTCSGWWRLSRT